VTERFAALPVPERDVPTDEVAAAKNRDASARSELAAIERDIQRAHGALEQVGGAVAESGCATRPKRLSWPSAMKGKSKRTMRLGSCCLINEGC